MAITAAKLSADSVTTDKVQDGAITQDKLASDVTLGGGGGGSGIDQYESLSDRPVASSSITDGKLALVYDDDTEANNGLYRKTTVLNEATNVYQFTITTTSPGHVLTYSLSPDIGIRLNYLANIGDGREASIISFPSGKVNQNTTATLQTGQSTYEFAYEVGTNRLDRIGGRVFPIMDGTTTWTLTVKDPVTPLIAAGDSRFTTYQWDKELDLGGESSGSDSGIDQYAKLNDRPAASTSVTDGTLALVYDDTDANNGLNE